MAYLVNRRVFTIEWGLCDPAGIVFNPRFEFFDWGTWACSMPRSTSNLRNYRPCLALWAYRSGFGARFMAPAPELATASN